MVITDPTRRREIADLYQRATDRYLDAMLATFDGTGNDQADTSFMRGVALTRHLAEHLAEVPFVLFCLTRYENTLHDETGPLDIGGLESSIFPAVQNFMLAARDIGLGTTLTTVFRVYHQELKELIGLRDHHDVVALVPIGHPLGNFGVAQRKPVTAVTSWNQYGDRRG